MELNKRRTALIVLGGGIGAAAGLLVANMQPELPPACPTATIGSVAVSESTVAQSCVPAKKHEQDRKAAEFPTPLLVLMTTGTGLGIAQSLTKQEKVQGPTSQS